MTWNQDQDQGTDASSVDPGSPPSGSDTRAPEKIYHLKSGAWSSSLAEITSPTARNAVRRWLVVAKRQAQRNAEAARSARRSKAASIYEQQLGRMVVFTLALGPEESETLPETEPRGDLQ